MNDSSSFSLREVTNKNLRLKQRTPTNFVRSFYLKVFACRLTDNEEEKAPFIFWTWATSRTKQTKIKLALLQNESETNLSI